MLPMLEKMSDSSDKSKLEKVICFELSPIKWERLQELVGVRVSLGLWPVMFLSFMTMSMHDLFDRPKDVTQLP